MIKKREGIEYVGRRKGKEFEGDWKERRLFFTSLFSLQEVKRKAKAIKKGVKEEDWGRTEEERGKEEESTEEEADKRQGNELEENVRYMRRKEERIGVERRRKEVREKGGKEMRENGGKARYESCIFPSIIFSSGFRVFFFVWCIYTFSGEAGAEPHHVQLPSLSTPLLLFFPRLYYSHFFLACLLFSPLEPGTCIQAAKGELLCSVPAVITCALRHSSPFTFSISVLVQVGFILRNFVLLHFTPCFILLFLYSFLSITFHSLSISPVLILLLFLLSLFCVSVPRLSLRFHLYFSTFAWISHSFSFL